MREAPLFRHFFDGIDDDRCAYKISTPSVIFTLLASLSRQKVMLRVAARALADTENASSRVADFAATGFASAD